jgi:uncharacterized protein with NRDE domain
VCLLVFAWNAHARYRLVLAGNRDEYHARATDAAGWWPDSPDLLGGRDLEAGGTWLAVARDGRWGVVTNYREIADSGPAQRSRGELIVDFIHGNMPPQAFGPARETLASQYAGYSLLVGDRDSLHYFTNRGAPSSPLPAGIHGLSNERLNTPWPKLERTRRRFEGLVAAGDPAPETLFELLADREPATADQVPRTGLDMALERLVSAPFVISQSYGTRSSHIVLAGHDDHVRFLERRFDAAGSTLGTSEFEFDLAP